MSSITAFSFVVLLASAGLVVAAPQAAAPPAQPTPIDPPSPWPAPLPVEAERDLHRAHLWGVAVSPSGERVYAVRGQSDSLGSRGELFVWAVKTDEVRRVKLRGDYRSVALSHDGRALAVGGVARIALCDASDGHMTKVWKSNGEARVHVIGLLPGDKSVVALREIVDEHGIVGGAIQDWDVETGTVSEPLAKAAADTASRAMAQGLTADGSKLVTAGEDKRVRAWLTADWTEAAVVREASIVKLLAAAPDGRSVFCVSPVYRPNGDEVPGRILDLKKERARITLSDEDGGVRSAAFSPDGWTLATGDWGGRIRLWDARTGRQVGEVRAFRGDGLGWGREVTGIAFTRDGHLIAACSMAGEVGIWRTVTEPATGGEKSTRRPKD